MDKKSLKIIESKNNDVKKFIQGIVEIINEENMQDCICTLVYKNTTSDCFYTTMNFSNLIGYIRAQEHLLLEDWLE